MITANFDLKKLEATDRDYVFTNCIVYIQP